MIAHARALPVVLAISIALAGCNSDEDGGDQRGDSSKGPAPADPQPADAGRGPAAVDETAIRAVVVRLFKSSDVRWICERALTPRLFELIYASPAACRKAAADEEDDRPPRRVEVSDIRTRGGAATAHARLIGGDSGGSNGLLSLAKRGEEWRLDDLSVALLRSLTTAGLRNDNEVPAATGRCIQGRFARMPDERFKRLAYGLLGRRPRASARLLELWSDCERGRKGGSSLRKPLERAITQQLRRAQARRAVVTCVIRRLRSTLPDRLLIRLSTAIDRSSKARLNREVLAAAIACGFRPRSGDGRLTPA